MKRCIFKAIFIFTSIQNSFICTCGFLLFKYSSPVPYLTGRWQHEEERTTVRTRIKRICRVRRPKSS